MDNPDLLTPENLRRLRTVVEQTAADAAHRLGINPPAAYTCTKPSGTVSQVVDCAPGCHPRWSHYYIRRYRIARSDPLFIMLQNQGLPFKPEVGQTAENFNTAIVEFPVAAPPGAIVRDEWDAIQQLEWYRRVQKNWSTHNVSTTVYVKDDEWLKVGNYVYENWDGIVGVSFFPYEGANYELAPYEELTREQYERMAEEFPKLDFSKLWVYELLTGDTTLAGREYACLDASGMCEAP
jgi:hypothetical protein